MLRSITSALAVVVCLATDETIFNPKTAGFAGLHPGRFEGKVCFITGATSGLGEHAAYHLAQEGCAVAVTGRREKEGTKVVEHIKGLSGISAMNPPAMFIKVDVTDDESQAAAIVLIEKTWGRLDAVFANAGVGGANFAQGDPDSLKTFKWIIDVNVNGVFSTVLNSVPLMKQSGGGQILLCSSMSGLVGVPMMSAYVSSKHALEGMKKALAQELVSDNIRVNNLNPSWTPSELTSGFGSMPAFMKGVIEVMQPDGKMCDLAHTSAATAFLLSEDSQYMSGLSLPVSLGMETGAMSSTAFKAAFMAAMGEAQAAATEAAKDEL